MKRWPKLNDNDTFAPAAGAPGTKADLAGRVEGTPTAPGARPPRLAVAFKSFDRDSYLLDYAAQRATSEGAELHLVHVLLTPGPPGRVAPELGKNAVALVDAALTKLAAAGAAATGSVKQSVAACAGLAISEEAVAWGATAVVVGAPRQAPGNSGGPVYREGVRDQVLRCSWRPTLLVAPPAAPPGPTSWAQPPPAHLPGSP